MNPFIQSVILVLVRSALLWIAGHLGIATTDAEIVSAALWVIATAWGIWTQYKAHQFTVTAQAADRVLTREDIKAVIANGGAPSVLTPSNEIPQA